MHLDTFDRFDRAEMFVVAAALIHADLADLIRSGIGPSIVEPGGIAHAALVWALAGDDSGMTWWSVNRPGELARWLDCLEVCDACNDHAEAARYIELQRVRRRRQIASDALQHAGDSVGSGADPLCIWEELCVVMENAA